MPTHSPLLLSSAAPGGGCLLSTMTRRYSFLAVSLLLHIAVASTANESETETLLQFKKSLQSAAAFADWDPGRPPCGSPPWTGVLCDDDTGRVWGLHLEGMALEGVIDVETLTKLPDLRSVSFMRNNLSGNLPYFSKLSRLKAVYLSHNRFSSVIGEGTFAGMASLKKLYLTDNRLIGTIPVILAALPRLTELALDRNQLEGRLPNFPEGRLQVFNVSHNRLSGEIPAGLVSLNSSFFSGNKELCGKPLDPCSNTNQTPSQSQGPKLSLGTLILTIAAAVVALVALIVVAVVSIFLLRRLNNLRQPDREPAVTAANLEQGGGQAAAVTTSTSSLSLTSPATTSTGGKPNLNLTFLKDGAGEFNMADLLNASAEHLGHGALGNTYKASLSDRGIIVVVKRFERMKNSSREEFGEHMRRLGRLRHGNVLPIVAFYYKREEKILVTDYAVNSSLAAQIHGGCGNRRRSRALDWPARLRIVNGVALGVQYLHTELPSLKPPHGHLKSSNVVLDGAYKPLLTDYGLIPFVSDDVGQKHLVAYKSPEYTARRKLTKKTDIWCFGILILEIITGKLPGGGGGADKLDLAKWIELIMQNTDDNASTAAVFDRNMTGTNRSQGEMAKLLRIGLYCCQEKPEARPNIDELVSMLEEIKERDVDDDFYTTYSTEADMRSSRGLSDDFRAIDF